jgi:integrase
LERKHSRIIRYVFTHRDGEKISSIRKAWAAATLAAGCPGVLLHDLRRSAIMTFSQKGIDQQTGMLLSGHKTASVYRRYNIPTEEVLRSAAEKLEKPSVQNPTDTKTDTMEVSDQNLSNLSDWKENISGA